MRLFYGKWDLTGCKSRPKNQDISGNVYSTYRGFQELQFNDSRPIIGDFIKTSSYNHPITIRIRAKPLWTCGRIFVPQASGTCDSELRRPALVVEVAGCRLRVAMMGKNKGKIMEKSLDIQIHPE